MADLETNPYPLPQLSDHDMRRSMKRHSKAMRRLLGRSDRRPKGTIVNGVLRWPTDKGSAYYLVTKEEPLTVQYIPWFEMCCADLEEILALTHEDVAEMLR